MQDLAAQAARLRGEAERAGRDRAGMEEVYLSLKRGVEAETQSLKAKFDELQARVLEADAKRDQVRIREVDETAVRYSCSRIPVGCKSTVGGGCFGM